MRQILVDASNMWCRAYYGTYLELPGGAVMVMGIMLKKLINHFGKGGVDSIVMCWDKGHSNREEIDANYKANRELIPGRENVWKDIHWVKKLVSSAGIKSAYFNGYEADDVIASLSKNFIGETIIVSNDKDFYQLINDKKDIKVYKPGQKIKNKVIPAKIIKEEDVLAHKDFLCMPIKVTLVKAFKGDVSDNVPKLADHEGKAVRWSKKFKEPFYEIVGLNDKVKTIDDFYKYISCFETKYQPALNSFKEQAKKNFEIVTMKRDLEVEFHKPRSDREWFEDICEKLDINKITYGDITGR